MFNLTLFVSTYSAVVLAFGTMEVYGFLMSRRAEKKDTQRREEFEEEFAQALSEGKIPVPRGIDLDTIEKIMQAKGTAGPTLTVSGEATVPEHSSETGQYL